MISKVVEDFIKEVRLKTGEDIRLTPLTKKDREVFEERFFVELGVQPNSTYLEMLEVSDGLVYEGVFLYSAISRKYPGSNGVSMELIDLNRIHREPGGYEGYVFYGDSDTDVFVYDVETNSYQIRDRVGFDEDVYEEFSTMEELLIFVVNLMRERV